MMKYLVLLALVLGLALAKDLRGSDTVEGRVSKT